MSIAFSFVTGRRSLAFLLMLSLFIIAFPGVSAAQTSAMAPADGDLKWQGVIESMPSTGLIGAWVIGGKTFSADASTQFEQEHGSLQVGSCAKVEYEILGSANHALNIKSDAEHNCNGGGGEDHAKTYGRIDAMPVSGFEGNWTIDGVNYTADAGTQFEQEHGAFASGVCVEVEYQNGDPRQATKIATERDYKCDGGSGGGEQHDGELYGTIISFPQGLIGQWEIGGMSFQADASTRFEQEHVPFAVGVLVEVKFYTDANNVNHATKIESKNDADGGDGGNHGDGHEGHAYGLIGSMPGSGLMGMWTIGGVEYLADASTRFEQEHGPFAVGVQVKVRYHTDQAGQRIAEKIETSDDNGGSSEPTHAKLFGFVEQMPAQGFQGQWVVDGVALTADLSTQFEENHGLLAIGAYVEVEYTHVGGVNQMLKIETQVPPGAGPNDDSGVIQSTAATGNLNLDAANAAWVIGGKHYVVTAATDLNDVNGALTVGSFARVNSYKTNGQLVATRITGVALDEHLFLPFAAR